MKNSESNNEIELTSITYTQSTSELNDYVSWRYI